MKLLSFFMIVFSLQVSANSFSQNVTLCAEGVSLSSVFSEIKRQTGFVFWYDKSLISNTPPVTVKFDRQPLERALYSILSPLNLDFAIEKKVVVIKSKPVSAMADTSKPKAPPIDVSGRVVNENGEPVLASVSVKGTLIGVTTNENGEFLLKGLDENAILLFSGVGLEETEVKINGRKTLNVVVKVSIAPLEETVIKGYYVTSKKLNTGNVTKVTSESISKQPITNPLSALQGRVPGLYIQQSSGVPGSAFTVRLRGQNSINAGNDPLYVIDGVPYPSTSLTNFISGPTGILTSPFNNINTSDIESIEVLKDADATAIYGSRGANGVILITTKKGKVGPVKVDLNFYSGSGKVSRKMKLLNTEQYLEMRHEAFKNDNVTPTATNYDVNGVWDTTRYTDWQKVLTGGTAHIIDAQASISGGSGGTQFLIGGGYHKESTVFPGDFDDKKASIHFDLTNTSPNKRFKTNFSSFFVADRNTLPQINLNSYINLPPDAPALYDENGNLNWENNTWTNPLSYLAQTHRTNTYNLITNLSLSYELLSGLTINTRGGFNYIQMDEFVATPKRFYNPANFNSVQHTSNFSNNNIKTWIIEPQLNYSRRLGKGRLDILIGCTFQQNEQNILAQTGTGFSNESLMENLAAASGVTVNGVTYTKYAYSAVFGRSSYNWEDKYLINLTGRRDGSSRFGPGKQFANFGSIGSAWLFSNEKFIKQTLHFLTFGKLRGSYGITGNDQIGDYGFLDTYNSTGIIYQGVSTLSAVRLFNPEQRWETNKKLEIAIDLGFLNNRLLSSVSFFRNRSSNMLVPYPLPGSTGFSSIPFFNLPAVVQNRGWEIELNIKSINNSTFSWLTNFNITVPTNKLVSYPNLESSSFANKYQVGRSLYILKKYHFTGVDTQTGLYTFEDYNKNSTIDYPGDLQAIKEVAQKYFGGFQNIFKYRDLELDIFIQFVKQTGFNYMANFLQPGSAVNQPVEVMDRWQSAGDNSNIQQFTRSFFNNTYTAWNNNTASDNVISDASFIRLKNISLSYYVPKFVISKAHLQSARLFVQCQNLATLTSYRGLDPENQGSLPPLKMIVAGFQLTLK